MRNAIERLNVVVTADEKIRITRAARDAGISTGEYMRRAAAAYFTPEEEAVLDGMLRLLNESTLRTSAAIDSALAWIAASNRRIAGLDAD